MRHRAFLLLLVSAGAAILIVRATHAAHTAHVFAPLPPRRLPQPLPRVQRRPRLNHAIRRCARLHLAFVKRDDWPSLLELAHVYRTGEYPILAPNPDVAMALYRACCASPNPEIAGIAQHTYLECRLDPVAFDDIQGRSIPETFARDCLRHADALVARGPSFYVPKPRAYTPPPPSPPPSLHLQIRSDAQNVHDHALSAGLRTFANDVMRDNDHNDSTAVDASVLDVVLRHRDDDERQRAFAVLESLSDASHSRLDMSERQALHAVWHKLETLPEHERSNAQETLVKQLASGVEHGDVVCSTGKIARIVGTLDGIVPAGDAPSLRPMWAIREELGTLAAHVRDVRHGNADDFKEQATKTYVDELGMNPTILQPIVDEYAAGF